MNYKAAATQGKYRWCHNKLSVLTGNQKQDRMKQPVRVAILFIKEWTRHLSPFCTNTKCAALLPKVWTCTQVESFNTLILSCPQPWTKHNYVVRGKEICFGGAGRTTARGRQKASERTASARSWMADWIRELPIRNSHNNMETSIFNKHTGWGITGKNPLLLWNWREELSLQPGHERRVVLYYWLTNLSLVTEGWNKQGRFGWASLPEESR